MMPEGMQHPRASAYRYIRQSTSACVITNIYHFRHSEKLPKLKENCSIVFIVWVVDFDCSYELLASCIFGDSL